MRCFPRRRRASRSVKLVTTLGDTAPGFAEDAFTGSELLTPENASVTIETCVGGLIRA